VPNGRSRCTISGVFLVKHGTLLGGYISDGAEWVDVNTVERLKMAIGNAEKGRNVIASVSI